MYGTHTITGIDITCIFTGKFWFNIFLVLVRNMSNQSLPVNLKVYNIQLLYIVSIK